MNPIMQTSFYEALARLHDTVYYANNLSVQDFSRFLNDVTEDLRERFPTLNHDELLGSFEVTVSLGWDNGEREHLIEFRIMEPHAPPVYSGSMGKLLATHLLVYYEKSRILDHYPGQYTLLYLHHYEKLRTLLKKLRQAK